MKHCSKIRNTGVVSPLRGPPNKSLWHLYGPLVAGEGVGMEKYWMLSMGDTVFKVFLGHIRRPWQRRLKKTSAEGLR